MQNTMIKQLLFLWLLIIGNTVYSQIIFEKGYLINNADQRVDCLIEHRDDLNNPTSFIYKLSESAEEKTGNLSSVKEFGIHDQVKFVRDTVEVDLSKTNTGDLSYKKSPIFDERVIFLKVLVEGQANLFSYRDSNSKKYFFNKEGTDTEQLIYKLYKTNNGQIGKNNLFRQQLWTDLKCEDFNLKKVENLDYTEKELVHFFIDYNKCNNQSYTKYGQKEKTDDFNLTLRPGLNLSNLRIDNKISDSRDTKFSSELSFRFGLEAEYILPFNKGRWSAFIEPTFQSFSSKKELQMDQVKINYKSIELPVGIRHYIFLKDISAIFVNAAVVLDFPIQKEIVFEIGRDLDIEPTIGGTLGVGYKFNNRLSTELRFQSGRNLLNPYVNWNSNYSTLSAIFGYTLF